MAALESLRTMAVATCQMTEWNKLKDANILNSKCTTEKARIKQWKVHKHVRCNGIIRPLLM